MSTETVLDYHVACLMEISDLPDADREELADAIESAVNEVAAESELDVHEVLGPPGTFVAELRAAAGVRAAGPSRAWRSRMPSRLTGWATRAIPAVDLSRLTAHPWATWTAQLLRELRPAWWVVRALAVALFLGMIYNGEVGFEYLLGVMPFPKVTGSSALSLMLTIALIVGSVELGRRTLVGSRRTRMMVANAALVIATIGVMPDLRQLPSAEAAFEATTTTTASFGDSLAYIDAVPIVGYRIPDGTVVEGPPSVYADLIGAYGFGGVGVITADGATYWFESHDDFWTTVTTCGTGPGEPSPGC